MYAERIDKVNGGRLLRSNCACVVMERRCKVYSLMCDPLVLRTECILHLSLLYQMIELSCSFRGYDHLPNREL